MAQTEHLEILRQGKTAWNRWRRANPTIKPDLRGITLSRVELILLDLTDADFSDADLPGADLSESNLQGALFRGANLEGAYIWLINPGNCDFQQANLTAARFYGTALDQLKLRGPRWLRHSSIRLRSMGQISPGPASAGPMWQEATGRARICAAPICGEQS